MNFRQIIVQYTPIDSKNKLNNLLAAVERNFGLFSRDMELDIRSIISKSDVVDYFDRIIHENNPILEYDVEKKESKKSSRKVMDGQETPKQKLRRKRKEEEKKAKREKARQQLQAIRNAEKNSRSSNLYGKSGFPDKALGELVKNDRDYSKPSLGSQINHILQTENKERPRKWVSVISVPMGGQNKKY